VGLGGPGNWAIKLLGLIPWGTRRVPPPKGLGGYKLGFFNWGWSIPIRHKT